MRKKDWTLKAGSSVLTETARALSLTASAANAANPTLSPPPDQPGVRSMYELKIITQMACAHQLREFEGRCENLHGHNWKIEVFVTGEELEPNGILIDFKRVKTATEKVIDELDHKFLNDAGVLQGSQSFVGKHRSLHFQGSGACAEQQECQSEQGHGMGVGQRLCLLHGALSRRNLSIVHDEDHRLYPFPI